MGKFIILSFLVLGVVFYEMSGGTEFEPELRAPVAVAQTELAPTKPVAAAPQVARADTSSLIQIAIPAATEETQEAIVETAAFGGPIPAGEVVILPSPQAETTGVVAVEEPIIATPAIDLRAVAGDWVNMRSGPSTAYDVLDTLPRGTEAEVVEVNADGWARIIITDTGQEGWMAERLLSDI